MMGRLSCAERSESRKADDSCSFQTEQRHQTSNNIPLHPNRGNFFPPISHNVRSPCPQVGTSSFPDVAAWQSTGQPSFKEPSYPSLVEGEVQRGSSVADLPPILTPSSALDAVTMPPLNPHEMPPIHGESKRRNGLVDLASAYENMMVGYFMPRNFKPYYSGLQEKCESEQECGEITSNTKLCYDSSNSAHQLVQTVSHCDGLFETPRSISSEKYTHSRTAPIENISGHNSSSIHSKNVVYTDTPPPTNQHTTRDVTSSGCTMLETITRNNFPNIPQCNASNSNTNKSEIGYHSCNFSTASSCKDKRKQFTNSSLITKRNIASNIVTETSEPPLFIPIQNHSVSNSHLPKDSVRTSMQASASNASASKSNSNFPQPTPDPSWGRFSVLPPVLPSTAPGSCTGDGDNMSLLSYSSVPGNAQNSTQMGMYYSPFSPFTANFSENVSSAFTSSPRYSGRSSYSSRSRNKRALSNSPLSAEGIDINAIIRMSPTSLISYLNGSRSSSSCVSPGSLGDKTGCYGHLSARNSSSSPTSGSASSGNRRSTSYTPQTGTPQMSNSNPSIVNSDNSNSNDKNKHDFFDDSLFVIQAMRDLEAGSDFSQASGLSSYAQMVPDCENLQVLPQDLAAFATEDYIPFLPSVLPTTVQTQYEPPQSLPAVGQHNKPPPTYDQHMARKAILKKASSSDSSQPSNSSSFESSEGDKTVAGGSSGTDTDTNRMYSCRWLDCTSVFQDQDEFVTHIEKVHIEQKKGEDFVCYWKLCPRRLHPFNARYKLLVHMRIHSGDKPNKCTYTGCKKAFSRLENLKIHLRSHTGEKPYTCTHSGCTKTFSNSSDRTKHQKTHHETKPYICQVAGCGKRYTDPSSLRKHVKKSHPDKKEPDRKKIRGGVELEECLVVQAIKPVLDVSPPEPTDSGLGRSPQPTYDQYPGLLYPGESYPRSEITQTSSISPSSHHSTPRDRDNIPPNNNNLRVPILPPITPVPMQQQHSCLQTQTQIAIGTKNAPLLPTATIHSPEGSDARRSSSHAQFRSKMTCNVENATFASRYSSCSNARQAKSSVGNSFPQSARYQRDLS